MSLLDISISKLKEKEVRNLGKQLREISLGIYTVAADKSLWERTILFRPSVVFLWAQTHFLFVYALQCCLLLFTSDSCRFFLHK